MTSTNVGKYNTDIAFNNINFNAVILKSWSLKRWLSSRYNREMFALIVNIKDIKHQSNPI